MSRRSRSEWFASKCVGRSTAGRRPAGPVRRRLRFEPLEDRRLLSITVDTLADESIGSIEDGDVSLRDAIILASSGETIDFDPALTAGGPATITLELGELLINKALTIVGPGANLLTIDANGDSRVFLVNDGDGGTLADVVLQDLTITGGVTPDDGGGIWSRENLTVTRSVVKDNQADDGGGLFNFAGQFSIVDSTFSGNRSTDTIDGGGGGLFNFSEVVSQTSKISNSTFSDNATATSGGSAVSNNGGGVYNFLGTIDVEFSTFTENEAPAGKGSGIASLGDMNFAITRVYSSIIAGNVNSDVDRVVGASISFQSLGFNVIGFGTDAGSPGPFTAIGDQRMVADPMLGPLAAGGGPTPTHALLAGSPAVDAGDFDALAGEDGVPEFDQRGMPFGRVVDGDDDGTPRIDVGAFESHAFAYVVDTLVDEDDGIGVGNGTSLRDAINAANVDPGEDEILFSLGLFSGGPATIDLLLGELLVTDSIRIAGPGAEWLTIDAQQNSRIFNVDDGDDFNLLEVTISGLTLTGGSDPNGGGAIFSQETLTVSDSVVTGNTAQWGGGVYNALYGELTVLRSEISGNTASLTGGGLYNFGGTVTIRESTVTGNNATDAAGVHNAYYGYLAVQKSVVSGNIGFGSGGGIKNDGTAIVEESRISGNEAATGGGIYTAPYSYLSVSRSTVSGNTASGSGGGLFNNYATLYISDSTLSENTAAYGGGLYTAGPAYDSAYTRVSNSTISGNTATVTGGAMYLFGGSTAIEFSTITDNHAPAAAIGGIGAQHPSFARAVLYHTILAGNDHLDAGPTAEINSFTSLGYNLVGTLGVNVDTFTEMGDQVAVTDPKLGALADNGGPTMTHALLAGSPAIDAGDSNLEPGIGIVPFFDQRGEPFDRVRDGDAAANIAIDIGAFEVQQFVAGPALPGDYNEDGVVDAADYTKWRDTLGQTGLDPFSGADGNGNSEIDSGDYQVWVDHFGESLEPEGSAAGDDMAEALAIFGGSGGEATDPVLVTTLLDVVNINDGVTSLREALFATNLVPGANGIAFDPLLTAGGPATILLTLGELAITDSVTIIGPGAELLTIDASGNDSDPNVNGNGSRVFNIDDGVSGNAIEVEIRGLTLTGGDTGAMGGAVFSREKLLASELIITGNRATSGGAIVIFVDGATTTIENSTISGNMANGGGGAILVQAAGAPAPVVIAGNTISGNMATTGGAIAAGQAPPNSTLLITGNDITGNSATTQGGAIFLFTQSAPKTTITNSTLSGNTSGNQGGAIFANGARDLSIVDSTIADNRSLATAVSTGRGGGIYAAQADVAITGSTISGNMAVFGGGIYSRFGELAVSFSAIDGNTAQFGDGGGILSNSDRLSLLGSTISGNSAVSPSSNNGRGGGLWFMPGSQAAPLSIVDTSLSGNSASTEGGGAYFRTIGSETISSAIMLTNVVVAENSAGVHGGGIALGPGTQALAGSLTLNGGSIRGNMAGVHGGGVYARANSLTFNATTITGNEAQQNGGGVATPIFAAGQPMNLTFIGTTISDNVAGAGTTVGSTVGVGGGVWVPAGAANLTFVNSEIMNNAARRGGGVFRSSTGPAGLFNVIDSHVSGNTAVISGGGIDNQGGFLSVTGTTISNNAVTNLDATGGGGVSSRQASVSIVGSSLTGNSTAGGRGGGMYSAGGDVTITASTIAGNSARTGGGGLLAITAPLTRGIAIHSSTVSGNSSFFGAGGLSLQGFASIRHSTITLNASSGGAVGGVDAGRGGMLELDHTIIAGNTIGDGNAVDLLAQSAPTLTARFSLIGDNRGTALAEAPVGSPDVNGNLIGRPVTEGGSGVIDPLLMPLANNGGPTLTHALLPGSPALDAGALITGPPLGFDQRGNPFSRMIDGTGDGVVRIDIGAYEAQGVTTFAAGDYNRNGLVDAADYTVWRDTHGQTGLDAFDGADGNGDGEVNWADHAVWSLNFGSPLIVTPPALGGASTSAVTLTKLAALVTQPSVIATSNSVAATAAAEDGVPQADNRPLPPVGGRFLQSASRQTSTRPTATLISAAELRDDALLAWIAARSNTIHADHNRSVSAAADANQPSESPHSDLDAVDAIFASLIGNRFGE